MSTTPNTEATGKPTPLAGCAIFIVIFGMVTFLACIGWYSYGENKAAIISISEEAKVATVVSSTENSDLTAALDSKMGNFESAVKNGDKATITFNVDELNLAIAHYPKLESFRQQMSIREITSEAIIADISFPVRPGFNDTRFLNGTMTMKPVIAMGSLFPIVTDISPVNGNPVPPKYTKEFPTFLFSEYRNDEELAEVFHKLSTVELESGLMTIISDPAIAQPDALPTDLEAKDKAQDGLMIIGLLTFMLITTVIFLLWVRKRKRKQNADAGNEA